MRVESVVARRAGLQSAQRKTFAAQPRAHAVYLNGGDLRLQFDNVADAIFLKGSDFLLIAPGQSFTLWTDAGASLVCGQLQVTAWTLPPWMHIPSERSRTLRVAMDLLAEEASESAGSSEAIARRLADVLLLYARREQGSSPQTLEDPRIDASLHAMHRAVHHPWTVAELATAAGMSRSVYAQRFKELTGEGPLEHLTRWRMQKARDLLLETDRTLGDVAASIGYATDGAFHRAFRRETGVSPGEFRRRA